MAVYIAVCDDNIADRKQSERLLEREKDARLKKDESVLYIESFGSIDALMKTPVKYDIFFIDITIGSSNGMDLAKMLRKKGIIAPIVLCTSTIEYTSYVNTPDNIIFINKPINAGQISHLIDVATDWSKRKIHLIEVRMRKETLFLKYTDIVKATPKAKFLTEVALADGTYVDMDESFDRFFNECASYGCFIKCGKSMINLEHITSGTRNGFALSNGDIATYTIFQKKEILEKVGDYIPSLHTDKLHQ